MVIPETTPPGETVAMAVLPLLQAPPEVVSTSVVVDPSQKLTADEGVMAAGELTTVTVAVAEQLPAR